jgi:AcrR family transcriptional regulator
VSQLVEDEDSATDERLLAVAERLFAANGIDAVSVRSITIEAEANIASVHYHFGTKIDLVRALVERRVDEVNADRRVRLRALDRQSAINARDVASVWIEPLARLALDPARRAYLGFIVALNNAGPAMQSIADDVFRPHYPRLDAALERALPGIDTPVRRFRFTLAVHMSMRALADLSHTAAPWRSERRPIDDRALIDAIIDAFTGLLEGPSHAVSPTRRHQVNAD